jgi:pyruvate,orthophosphate dikinase
MTTADASRVYLIGGRGTGDTLTSSLVGGKAAQLVRLNRLGLNVPPALALPTAFCRAYMDRGALPADFAARLAASLRQLEEATGLTLGGTRPLLVSVRSSPPTSMPGMLGTILNVGLTDEGVGGLIRRTGNPWLAWDVYRRFIRSICGAQQAQALAPLDRLTAAHLAAAGVERLQDLDPIEMRNLARACAARLPAIAGSLLTLDPIAQITAAVESVLQSWLAPPAREYRRLNGLDERTGTGVLIQAMVFGNSGPRSGSGVGFTRNPATGDRELYVDFLFNAQGEDVVSGRRPVVDSQLLPVELPHVWRELEAAKDALEREFLDMQDFEFTVDEGRLFFLQTRAGKRTPWAALRIATDLVQERILDPATALERLDRYDLNAIARVTVRPGPQDIPLAHGTAASLGVATGHLVFDAERAQRLAREQPVILARTELTTDDVAGLAVAAGVVTTLGGRTSHAAVVARQLGKVCLVGCADVHVDEDGRACAIGARRLREGDVITLDGETGWLYDGPVPIVTERPDDALALVAAWQERRDDPATVNTRRRTDPRDCDG